MMSLLTNIQKIIETPTLIHPLVLLGYRSESETNDDNLDLENLFCRLGFANQYKTFCS